MVSKLAAVQKDVGHGLPFFSTVAPGVRDSWDTSAKEEVFKPYLFGSHLHQQRTFPFVQIAMEQKHLLRGFGCVTVRSSSFCLRFPIGMALFVCRLPTRLINLIISTQPVTHTTKGMVGKPEAGAAGAENVIIVPYYDNVPRAYYKEDLEKQGWSKKANSV
jgi:hypothetical protein